MNRHEALAYRRRIEHAAAQQTDEDALNSIELFTPWGPDIDVIKDKRYQFGGHLWRCLQSHHTQADWTPDTAPSLFVEVSVAEIREITDPIPAENPFMKDEKGRWKGEVYVSQIDNNIWTPDAYPAGWVKE